MPRSVESRRSNNIIKGQDIGKRVLELLTQLGKEVNRLRQTFQAFKTTVQTTTTTYADLTTWASPVEHEDPSFSFNTTTGVLTINEDGRYEITVQITNDGAGVISRSQMDVQLQHNLGAGYVLPTLGFASNYGPRLAGIDDSSVWIPGYQLDMSSGDLLKIQVRHASQAVDVYGRLSIRRIT